MKYWLVEFVDHDYVEVYYKRFTDVDKAKEFVEERCKFWPDGYPEAEPWTWRHYSAQPEYDYDSRFPTNGEHYVYDSITGDPFYIIYGCDLVEDEIDG